REFRSTLMTYRPLRDPEEQDYFPIARDPGRRRADSIPVQTSLEAGPAVLSSVNIDVSLSEPLACCDFGCGRHMLHRGLTHPLIQIHHVIGRHPGHLFGSASLQWERLVPLPVRALEVIVGAEEGPKALRAVSHVRIGLTGRIVVLVVFAGIGQGC